jgi:hypothetical protein
MDYMLPLGRESTARETPFPPQEQRLYVASLLQSALRLFLRPRIVRVSDRQRKSLSYFFAFSALLSRSVILP